jgi:hypothetical protein
VRGIPTQIPKVMRRNPNLECPVLIMVSPFVRLGWTLRRVQAAPDVKSRFFSRKPEGNSKCQAQKLVLRHFPSHLHEGCRIVVACFAQPAENQTNFSYTEKHSIGSAERWELLSR